MSISIMLTEAQALTILDLCGEFLEWNEGTNDEAPVLAIMTTVRNAKALQIERFIYFREQGIDPNASAQRAFGPREDIYNRARAWKPEVEPLLGRAVISKKQREAIAEAFETLALYFGANPDPAPDEGQQTLPV